MIRAEHFHGSDLEVVAKVEKWMADNKGRYHTADINQIQFQIFDKVSVILFYNDLEPIVKSKLSWGQTHQSAVGSTCPRCQAVILKHHNYCGGCGTPISD